MRQDKNLVRDILLVTASSREGIDAKSLTGKKHDFSEVAYHMEMMKEAGLIKANSERRVSCSLRFESEDYPDSRYENLPLV